MHKMMKRKRETFRRIFISNLKRRKRHQILDFGCLDAQPPVALITAGLLAEIAGACDGCCYGYGSSSSTEVVGGRVGFSGGLGLC